MSSAGGDVIGVSRRFTRPAPQTPDMLVLLNIMNAHPASIRFKYAQMFARLEDLSHVMVWSKLNHGNADNEATIYKIELPRLKMAFMPKVDADGVTRLYSLDQSGWFVSERASLQADRTIPVPVHTLYCFPLQ
eukprot:SAG31_NODE_7228_length_1749_cov_1.541212_1_plen_133_part_00